jgi:hypothetical protein
MPLKIRQCVCWLRFSVSAPSFCVVNNLPRRAFKNLWARHLMSKNAVIFCYQALRPQQNFSQKILLNF